MEERLRHRRQEEQRGATEPTLSSGDDESTDGEEEFEFPCFLGADHGSPALADDLFADGRIRPAAFYPVFGRPSAGAVDGVLAAPEAPAPERRRRGQLGRLFLEESRAWNSSTSSSSSTESSTSTATDDLEGAAPESYCVWTPGAPVSSSSSPRPSKSGSTGSMARWRRVSDLVVGRSHSDGKEKFLFLPANPPTPINNPSTKQGTAAAGAKKKAAPGTEINTVAAAQRMSHYGAAKAVSGIPRRTFLPYREELVGFFANVHGISRSHPHPY